MLSANKARFMVTDSDNDLTSVGKMRANYRKLIAISRESGELSLGGATNRPPPPPPPPPPAKKA